MPMLLTRFFTWLHSFPLEQQPPWYPGVRAALFNKTCFLPLYNRQSQRLLWKWQIRCWHEIDPMPKQTLSSTGSCSHMVSATMRGGWVFQAGIWSCIFSFYFWQLSKGKCVVASNVFFLQIFSSWSQCNYLVQCIIVQILLLEMPCSPVRWKPQDVSFQMVPPYIGHTFSKFWVICVLVSLVFHVFSKELLTWPTSPY